MGICIQSMRKRTDEKAELGQLVKGDDTDWYVMEKKKIHKYCINSLGV